MNSLAANKNLPRRPVEGAAPSAPLASWRRPRAALQIRPIFGRTLLGVFQELLLLGLKLFLAEDVLFAQVIELR